MSRIVLLDDVPRKQSRPQPADFILVQLSKRVAQPLRRRLDQRDEAMIRQRLEDLVVIDIHDGDDSTLAAAFSQASVNMRCTKPATASQRPRSCSGRP